MNESSHLLKPEAMLRSSTDTVLDADLQEEDLAFFGIFWASLVTYCEMLVVSLASEWWMDSLGLLNAWEGDFLFQALKIA